MAIILVESYFRPAWWRAAEYLCWAMRRALRTPDNRGMSLGAGQVQAAFLLAYLAQDGRTPTLWRVIAIGEHFGLAADLTAEFLTKRAGMRSISREYTGCHNTYYEHLIQDVGAALRAGTVGRRRVA